MATQAKATAVRYVKNITSGIITNTQYLAAVESTAEALKTAAWRKAYAASSRLPLNNPTLPSHENDAYDAFQQSGAAATKTGEQAIWMGAAAYRITLPAGEHVASVSFRLAADKFLVGGLRVAAVLTDSDTPPADWRLCVDGGVENVVDATGKFATPKTETATGSGIYNGVLSTSVAVVADDVNKTGVFSLDLSAELSAHTYLYLVVTLCDPGRIRREYYVEGSGLIDGSSLVVAFAGDGVVMPVETSAAPVRLAVQQTGASRRVTFSGVNHNLQSGYLQLQWGARMLLAGFVDPVSDITTNIATLDSDQRLAPRVTIAGTTSTAKGELVEAYCAEPLVAGYTLWIQCGETPEGTGRIRISVLASDAVPDVTSGAMWDGSAADVIGTALVHPAAGEWVGVPIKKNAPTRKLQIVAAVAEISVADAAAIAVGFASTGLRLADMHVAQTPAVAAAAAVPATGIMVLHPDALSSGNIYRNINSGLTIIDPIHDRGIYGLSSSASACIYGTSYGAWTNLDGSAAAPFDGSNSHLGIWSGDGFFLALDSNTRKWCKAGSLPVALAALTDTTSSAWFDRIVVDGGTVAWVDAFVGGIKTTGAAGAWKTELDTWTDALLIAKAGNITIAICTDGVGGTVTKAHVYNDNGAKAAFESVVGANDVVVSASSISHMVIFRMTNGTVRAFTWNVFGAPVEVTLAWTTVTDVAISDGKFWAIAANTLLCSAAKPAWADDSAIPATATRKTLISGGGRLGIAYS